uniref:Uncharacterized protein n=1 Tax=Arundo donax TaxID=35708 RepID=A0A0A9GWT6_ARUDO
MQEHRWGKARILAAKVKARL